MAGCAGRRGAHQTWDGVAEVGHELKGLIGRDVQVRRQRGLALAVQQPVRDGLGLRALRRRDLRSPQNPCLRRDLSRSSDKPLSERRGI